MKLLLLRHAAAQESERALSKMTRVAYSGNMLAKVTGYFGLSQGFYLIF